MMSDLDDRIRRLLGGPPGVGSLPAAVGSPVQAAAPRDGDLIRVLFNCSAKVRPFVVVTELHGEPHKWADWLTMLRNEEVPQSAGGYGGGPVSSPASLGSFSFDVGDWPGCPHCGARENLAHNASGFWLCTACGGGMNCLGSDRRGQFHCACGRVVTGGFTPRKFFDVHGSRSSAASAPPLQSPRSSAAVPRPAPLASRLPPPRPPVARGPQFQPCDPSMWGTPRNVPKIGKR